jgi:acyl-CoA thioesterase
MSFAFSRFASAIAVDRMDETRWQGEILPDWNIRQGANGGYLLAIAARVGVEATGRPDPATLTGQFLAPAQIGPIRITTETVRSGRRFTTVRTTVTDEGDKPLLATQGSYTELPTSDTLGDVEPTAPEFPPPEECVLIEPTEEYPPPVMAQIEVRMHPEDIGFAFDRPTGKGVMRGWFRFRESQPIDTLGLLVAADTFPPTVFNADHPVAWSPTVELTAHIRARPSPGSWIACSLSAQHIGGGFVDEDAELWDDTGRLVARTRQLALLPRA